MKIDKIGKFLDFNQLVSLLYDGGKFVAREKNNTEVVGFVVNSLAFAKYYCNNNQIYVIFLDYVNREDLIKKLKEYCKELEKDNNLVVDFHFGFPGTATISWHEKEQ